MPDFLPRRESDLLAWSAAFALNIAAAPGDYGMTAEQAADYAALHARFAERLAAANQPSTRTPLGILIKDESLAALKADARRLARIARAAPGVGSERLYALGLGEGPRPASAVRAPAAAPVVRVAAVEGRRVRVQLADAASQSRRGKPSGVAGAALFSHVGEAPPASAAEWRFEGNASVTTIDVWFPGDLPPGARVWFTARWLNPRLQHGPMAEPAGTWIGGGMAKAA